MGVLFSSLSKKLEFELAIKPLFPALLVYVVIILARFVRVIFQIHPEFVAACARSVLDFEGFENKEAHVHVQQIMAKLEKVTEKDDVRHLMVWLVSPDRQ